MKFFKDLFTEADGTSFDIIPSLSALAVVAAIALQVYVSLHSGVFDILNFSTGISALMIGTGGAMKLKPASSITTTDK